MGRGGREVIHEQYMVVEKYLKRGQNVIFFEFFLTNTAAKRIWAKLGNKLWLEENSENS